MEERPIHKQCTCIIPCFNEQERILSVLQIIISLPPIANIIIVNDGSTDRSDEIIQQYCSIHPEQPITLISHKHNTGKAQAVAAGLQQVTTPYVLLFDADLTHVQAHEIHTMIDGVLRHPEIDMGILRRISSNRYIKLLYRELILSGQRILKTQDLKEIFASTTINRYQLEVAINAYMSQHHKVTVRYPFSANNTFKHQKRGFRYGWKRDMSMYRDIIAYQGIIAFARQILGFRPQSAHTYKSPISQ